ncbi:MATE family efflux transporter [Deltaproteobacteria bacterium]|nr:MATE family efflux transporter [Deltaproteobacteria bacterium]
MSPARHSLPVTKTYTHLHISSREIFHLTWPQLLMMCFQFLVGLTDVWVAGQIHRDVQAVLGLITQCQFLLLIVGVSAANASVAAMSQSLGADLPNRARRYAGLICKIGLTFAFVVLAFALLLRAPLLRLMQVPEEIRPLAIDFWQVFLLVLPSHYLLAMTGAIFRAHKWVYVPLFTAFASFAVNAFASTGFGLGWWGFPCLGARGIAYATLFSVTSMALINLCVLIRRKVLIKAAFAPWKWDKRALPYLIRVALPTGAMQFSWQLGYLVLFTLVASLPFDRVNALAGMAAGMRLESMLFLPAVAFNMTGAMLIGHLLGAGEKEEAKRVGWKIIASGALLMSIAALLLWPFLQNLAAFIAPDPGAREHALIYLRYNLLATPCSVTSMCLGGIMTGAGAALYTFGVFSIAVWAVRLPLAYLFGHFIWQSSEGVFMGMLVSQIFQSGLMLYIFQNRNWSRFAMIHRHKH